MVEIDDDFNFIDESPSPKSSSEDTTNLPNPQDNFKRLIQKIDSLPPLSNSAQKILELYANDEENIDIRQLARLIEHDTLLTANILAMINDRKYGFQNKITSISQAITLMGTRIVKGFVLSFAMREHMRVDMGPYGISNAKFNDMCHLQSALLFQWYMPIDMKKAQKLVPLALIMETGKVILAKEMLTSDYGHFFTEELYYAQDMQAVEHKYSDTTSYYIGGLLFEHWNFSPSYVDIMKSLDFDNGLDVDERDLDILDVIRTAVNIKGFLEKNNLDNACKMLQEIGMDQAGFMQAALRIKNAYEDARRASKARRR